MARWVSRGSPWALGAGTGAEEALTTPECSGQCQAGFYCVNGSISNREEPCPAGRWGAAGATDSACGGPCDAGYVCPAGSTSPRQQVCGGTSSYCPGQSGTAVLSSAGWYTTPETGDEQTRTGTQPCPLGAYCPGDGRRYPCPAGRFGDETGLSDSSCSGSCQLGWFCPEGSVRDDAQEFGLISSTDASLSDQQQGGEDAGTPGGTTFSHLNAANISSGQPISPPLAIRFWPPSSLPVSCEVISPDGNAVITHGAAVVTDVATFNDLTITAVPGTTVPVQLRCRRGAEEVVADTTVNLRNCELGEIQPVGLNRCVRCSEGQFSWISGERRAECRGCPVGAHCLGGGEVVAQQDSWRFSVNHLTFHECETPGVCLGYDPSTTNETSTAASSANASATSTTGRRRLAEQTVGSVSEGCYEGHEGPLCESCSQGYAKSTGALCSPCRSRWLSALFLGGATLLILIVICFMIYTTIRDNRRRKGSVRSSVQKVSCVRRR